MMAKQHRPVTPAGRRQATPLPRLGIFGLYGIGNFGNEATLTAVLERVDPNNKYDVLIIAEGAERVMAERGIRAVRLAPTVVGGTRTLGRIAPVALNRIRVIYSAFRIVGRLDAILVAGGGGWERLGEGPFGVPYELWALSMATRVLRRRIVLLNVGVERLRTPLSRYFVRSAARKSAYRSYRDDRSRQAAISMGVDAGSDPVVADLAFGLRVQPDPPPTPLAVRDRNADIVLGVMAYYGESDDSTQLDTEHGGYRQRIIGLIEELTQQGFDVTIIGGDEDDLRFAEEIAPSLSLDARTHVHISSTADPAELIAIIAQHRVAIAVRYHNVIMAALARVPVISIGYGAKHGEVMRSMEMADLVYEVDDFSVDQVVKLVTDVLHHADRYAAGITNGVASARNRLDHQWPSVERTINGGRPRAPQHIAGSTGGAR